MIPGERLEPEMHVLKLVYLNASFYPLLLLFTAVCILVFPPYFAFVFLFLSRRRILKQLRRIISWYGWIAVRILPCPLIRIEFKDLERDDAVGARLFICNHRSLSDAWLMGLLPGEFVQIAKGYVFRIPVLGIVAQWAGYLSVNEMPFKEFSRKVCRLLETGVSVVSFPEGTRSGSREIGQFHSGIFRVVLLARCPIVPLCITGTEKIPAQGSLLLRPGTIRVHKLPALHWEEYGELSAYELKNRIRNVIASYLDVLDREMASGQTVV